MHCSFGTTITLLLILLLLSFLLSLMFHMSYSRCNEGGGGAIPRAVQCCAGFYSTRCCFAVHWFGAAAEDGYRWETIKTNAFQHMQTHTCGNYSCYASLFCIHGRKSAIAIRCPTKIPTCTCQFIIFKRKYSKTASFNSFALENEVICTCPLPLLLLLLAILTRKGAGSLSLSPSLLKCKLRPSWLRPCILPARLVFVLRPQRISKSKIDFWIAFCGCILS